MTSLLDRIYAKYSNRRLFFSDGWGHLDRLRELVREGNRHVVPRPIDVRWAKTSEKDDAFFRQGEFVSPYDGLPLPDESKRAFLEFVLPKNTSDIPPVCIHFAATGDEGFARRRNLFALPLVKSGIASLILENPYYGRRRPREQQKKMLRYFSDLVTMGSASVSEGLALVEWLKKGGYTKIGLCGVSMGGSIAAEVAALDASELAVVGCLTAHSASVVFTEGLLSRYLAWSVLEGQLKNGENARELVRKILDLTDLTRLPPLPRPEAAFLVAATGDAYVPRSSAAKLSFHWSGSTMKWLHTGHVGAFLFHRGQFLAALRNAFARL